MNVVDTARDQLLGLVGKIVDHQSKPTSQTLTVACSVVEAEEFWRDPHRISAVLGEFGEVQFSEPDHYQWNLHAGDTAVRWDSRLISEDGGLRFTDDNGHQILVRYRNAPNHLGSEITLTADLPAPGLLVGAAAFAVLYRARALMQTGEVPTIVDNPSGRH